jgi:hypothetical protein
MRWAKRGERMAENRTALIVLVGKPDKKRLLGRSGSGQEDNIKIHLN